MENDELLQAALARRDPSVWASLYDRNVGSVFSFIYHLCGRNRDVAEEINQEVWLLAIERASHFDPTKAGFRTWLCGIARNRILQRHGRRQDQQLADEGPVDLTNPFDQFEELEQTDIVRGALSSLEDEPRRLLLDKYANGLSVVQIAAQTSRTPKAVESALTRARGQLRTLLRSYFASHKSMVSDETDQSPRR
jgi:RNA polymerase sigma-70 factor (ECF subfamily)